MLLNDECPKCGAKREAEADSRFCLICGADFKVSETNTVKGARSGRVESRQRGEQEALGHSTGNGNGSSDSSDTGRGKPNIPKFTIPAVLIAIAIIVAGVLLIPMLTSGEHGGTGGSNSEYVGEWYVPTDTDRRINISSDGSVTYGDDNHGTIASGKWTIIDEDAGAIKFTLKAQSGNERMFEEGTGEFTRMAYVQSSEKLTAQMYYSPSEWETYIKQ